MTSAQSLVLSIGEDALLALAQNITFHSRRRVRPQEELNGRHARAPLQVGLCAQRLGRSAA